MKQKFTILFLLLLLPCLLLSVSAENPLVVDNANLLSPGEVTQLETMAQVIRDTYDIDPVILTVDSLEGFSSQDYADSFYDANGYGDDGVLFLLAMEEREWYISTCGSCIYALTDYGIQQVGENAVWFISDGEYRKGFESFLSELPVYMSAYESGKPIDGYADNSGGYAPGTREETVYYEDSRGPNLLLSLFIGLASAAVAVGIMRASLKTNRPRNSAEDYMKRDSYHLRTHQDLFLYSSVSKTRRQQNTGSGGGGSSVHRSSGGRSHGGGGGRF